MTLIEGDCIEELKKLKENSIDFLLTDPPYGLAFMNKKWDDFSPLEFQKFTQTWAEQALRVMKPGAWGCVFGGTRTHHRLTCGLEDAGFDIKDELLWLYLSGFPKAQDISKFIDKYFGLKRKKIKLKLNPQGKPYKETHKLGDQRTKTTYGESDNTGSDWWETEPQHELAKLWNGFRTALKPAFEPIILIQKPMIGTYVQNILEHGVGGLNIDATRIPINLNVEDDARAHDQSKNYKITTTKSGGSTGFWKVEGVRKEFVNQLYEMKGRFPTNIIIDEMVAELFNMISGIDKPGATTKHSEVNRKIPEEGVFNQENSGFFYGGWDPNGYSNYGDEGGMSKMFKNIDKWCDPIKTVYGGEGFKRSFEHFNLKDGGGMGKFFYVPKAHTTEKELGLSIQPERRDKSRTGDPANPYNRNHPVTNFHPTVKPIKLLTYLVRLLKPPTKNPVCLDPFAGSGSTAIACKIEHSDFIIIEKNEKYVPIIQQRLAVPLKEFQSFTDSPVMEEDDKKQMRFEYF